jgi:hypothetical protein
MSMIEGHKVPLAVPVSAGAGPVPKAVPTTEGPSFGQGLKAIGDETRRGEALVERAVHAGGGGRDLAPAELIALQAGVYRWVEVVDLASKLVDRAAQAAKTVTQPGGG